MDPFLEVRGLTRTYRSAGADLTVLHEVSFAIQPGEAVAVVGPSGSGKSTLLGLIAGLDRPTAGSVSVAGRDLATLDEAAMARFRGSTMGFLFQQYRLLPALTAAENVRAPLELAGVRGAAARAQEWLAKVGLANRGHHLPAQLSGGEQQRVALARALVAEPQLLFADEPTGNLDSVSGTAIADLIFGLARERRTTCLLVTHDRALAARADRIIALKDGRVVST
jgi:putative ABC transport system ATP-binding protein